MSSGCRRGRGGGGHRGRGQRRAGAAPGGRRRGDGAIGTEAAREAADLVLTDDDFATIVAAIREGRAIADNIRKFVAFLLSANLGEVALFAVAIAGLGAPMTVVQVLVINVLTDGLPAVALTRDPPAPRPCDGRLSEGPAVPAARVGGAGPDRGARRPRGACSLPRRARRGHGEAQTMAFATIAVAELALVFAVRSPIRPAWEAPRNLYLVGGVVVSSLLLPPRCTSRR